jgi:PAS domain S-box-containing protein
VASALRAGASDYVPKNGDYLSSLPPLLRLLVSRQQAQHQALDDDAQREQHVLYIEPNTMDAELTQQHFAAHAPRLRLTLLTSCREALTVLAQPHGYDLVLTDLRVPGMDALEFLHEARQRQINVPFVIITGKGDEATAVALLRLGASDYLVKRDNYLMQLPHAVENALHRFRLDQRTSRLQAELGLNASLEAKVLERTAELHETQARLRATFDAIPDLIWQKDRTGHYQACNPAFRQLADRSSTAVLGSTDADLFDTVTAAALTEQHRCVVASAKPLVREQALQHGARGERVLFEVVSTPMLGSDGTVQGVLGWHATLPSARRHKRRFDVCHRFTLR